MEPLTATFLLVFAGALIFTSAGNYHGKKREKKMREAAALKAKQWEVLRKQWRDGIDATTGELYVTDNGIDWPEGEVWS